MRETVAIKRIGKTENLLLQGILEEYWSEIDPEYDKIKKMIPVYIEYLLNHENRMNFWILLKKKRIGIIFYYFYNIFNSEKGIHISELFLKKEHRGNGYGKETLAILRKDNCEVKEFKIEVLNSNEKGVKFWLSNKFDIYKHILKYKTKS